jgi:transcription antitermination factor NusG
MYLLRITKGKGNLISSILRKYGLEVRLTSEKGFLVCSSRPSPELMLKFETYLQGVIEVTDEEAERLVHAGEKSDEVGEIKAGSLVEVTSGVYQNFKGIVRRIVDSKAVIDLNLFGRVLPVEVSIDEMRLLKVADPWV